MFLLWDTSSPQAQGDVSYALCSKPLYIWSTKNPGPTGPPLLWQASSCSPAAGLFWDCCGPLHLCWYSSLPSLNSSTHICM